jgi:CheY-like chemotaxis protein
VLVVDDNDSARQALALQLGAWGCAVYSAADVSDALAVAQAAHRAAAPFDVVLVDKTLKPGEHVQLAADLRALLSPGARLILLAPLWDGQVETESERQLFDAQLAKPVRARLLRAALVAGEKKRPAAASNATPLASGTPQVNNRRVLLVEDNLVNQKVGLAMLRKLGVAADVAGNGQEAILALQQCIYDLVLMDCQMPDVDGLEASRRIRAGLAGEGSLNVPIVALTAHAMQGDREACLAAGMDDYLVKPLQLEQLQAVLSRCLQPSP